MISHIKSRWLRRSFIITTALPAIVVVFVLGAAAGALEHTAEMLEAIGYAWRGRAA